MAKGKAKKALLLGAVAGAGALVYRKYETLRLLYSEVFIGQNKMLEYEDVFDNDSLAFIGSVMQIDLTNVQFEGETAYLDLYATGSMISISVPADCRVVLEETKNRGGKVELEEKEANKTKTLYVDYQLMGAMLSITDQKIGECHHDGCCESRDYHGHHDTCCHPQKNNAKQKEMDSDCEDSFHAYQPTMND